MLSRAWRRWWTAHRTAVGRGGLAALLGVALLLGAWASVVTLPHARDLLAQLWGPGADRPLVGTVWHVIGGVPGIAPVPDTTVTVVFAADGTVRGTAGCNYYTGSYQRDRQQLTIQGMDKTVMACLDPGVRAQEHRFLDVLRQVTAGEITGTTLRLATPHGALHFTAATDWRWWDQP